MIFRIIQDFKKVGNFFQLSSLVFPLAVELVGLLVDPYEVYQGKPEFRECIASYQGLNSTQNLTIPDVYPRRWTMKYVPEIIALAVQAIHATITIVVVLNIIEGFFYFQIFKSIRKNKELDAKAKKILREIELFDKSDILASELSHGDRRKLEVGLALAMDPKVFLFDEPMAGLDESGTKMMINLFKKIKSNSPILLIEHDMDAVFALADRVSVINYGKIVATGTVDQIRSNDLVRDVYLGYEI